jgi:hypothetical protein
MQQPVTCKNCGLKWLRVTEGFSDLVFTKDLQYVCPHCHSNWYEAIDELYNPTTPESPSNSERCGAYAECWEELGKPQGWEGCSLPKGHFGNHQDKEDTK